MDQSQQRCPFRWTRSYDLMSVLIEPNRQVLHRLHIAPADEGLFRFGYLDLISGTPLAAFEALTIVQQIAREGRSLRMLRGNKKCDCYHHRRQTGPHLHISCKPLDTLAKKGPAPQAVRCIQFYRGKFMPLNDFGRL